MKYGAFRVKYQNKVEPASLGEVRLASVVLIFFGPESPKDFHGFTVDNCLNDRANTSHQGVPCSSGFLIAVSSYDTTFIIHTE